MKKSRPDYLYKSYVLSLPWYRDYLKLVKKFFLHYYGYNILTAVEHTALFDSLEYYELNYPKECEEIKKIEKARHNRTTLLRKRITEMLNSGQCLFLSITYNDNYYHNTTIEKRAYDIRYYLKQFNCRSIANIDFGKKNQREHYHAVIQADHIDITSGWFKKGKGSVNVEKIRYSPEDPISLTRLPKYITKLTNHAIKETTKRQSVIYLGFRK